MCCPVIVCGSQEGCIEWLHLPLFQVGGSLMLLTLLSPRHPINLLACSSGGSAVIWSPCLPYMEGRDLLFHLVFHPVTKFTPNLWWALNWWFGFSDWVSGWWIYSPGWWNALLLNHKFTMVSWARCQHKPTSCLGCEDYSILDQAVEDFEHGLDSILTDSIETPDQDAFVFFDEADIMPSSVT